MILGSIGYHSCAAIVLIARTMTSQSYVSEMLRLVLLPYLQSFTMALFQQENALPLILRNIQDFFFAHQTALLFWLPCSPDLLPLENVWSMIAERVVLCSPFTVTPDELLQHVEEAWTAIYQQHSPQSLFDLMPRHVADFVDNNDDHIRYWFHQLFRFTRSCIFQFELMDYKSLPHIFAQILWYQSSALIFFLYLHALYLWKLIK